MIAAIALVAVSTIYSAVSAYQQGQAQKKLADLNAQIAEQQAASQRAIGEYNAAKQHQKAERLLAYQRNELSQSGASLSEGSPLAILSDTMAQDQVEQAAIRFDAETKATNLDNQALGSRYQGQVAAWSGSQKAFGTVLEGASKIASLGASGAGSSLSNSYSQGMQSAFGNEPGSFGRWAAGNSGVSYGETYGPYR